MKEPTAEELAQVAERHRKLLFREWPGIAMAGWRGWQQWGRGVTVVQEASGVVSYWCWAAAARWAETTGDPAMLAEAASYDPTKQVVALVISPQSASSTLCIFEAQPPPPVCAAALDDLGATRH